MGAQINFLSDSLQFADPKEEPIYVLSTRIDDEYKLFETTFKQNQDLTWWLETFLSTWAEMVGMGKAKCPPPPHSGRSQGTGCPNVSQTIPFVLRSMRRN